MGFGDGVIVLFVHVWRFCQRALYDKDDYLRLTDIDVDSLNASIFLPQATVASREDSYADVCFVISQ